VIRENHETGERALDLLRWGLIPHGCGDPDGGRKPINARAETVAQLPTFRAGYAKRRCIVPVDCFFEWRATKGARAHALRHRRPVGETASSAKRRLDSHLRYPHRAGE
jgi:putative SOS response-associated peptidase YedK